jgi:hypothetical protein
LLDTLAAEDVAAKAQQMRDELDRVTGLGGSEAERLDPAVEDAGDGFV